MLNDVWMVDGDSFYLHIRHVQIARMKKGSVYEPAADQPVHPKGNVRIGTVMILPRSR